MTALPAESVNDPLTALLEKVDGLAVLPHVVFKVLEVSSSEDASPLELERAISVDPGFSSKVLTLANSAYFGLPRRVTSIREAILFLGFRAVHNLAMTVGTYDMFFGKTDKESLRRRSWWRHSVDAAVCCKWIAFHTRKAQPDESYTSGLLHLIGKTLLDRFGHGDYGQVQILTANGLSELDAEAHVFGCHHIQVSTSAAERWGFPATLISGLAYLMPPEPGDLESGQRCCTAVGSAIAELADFRQENPSAEAPEGWVLPLWAAEYLGVSEDGLEMLVQQGIGAIAAAQLHLV